MDQIALARAAISPVTYAISPFIAPADVLYEIYKFYSNEKRLENYDNVFGPDQLKKICKDENIQYATEKIINIYLFLLSNSNDTTKIDQIHLALCKKLKYTNNYPNKFAVVHEHLTRIMSELLNEEINSIDNLIEKMDNFRKKTDQTQRRNFDKSDFYMLFTREAHQNIKDANTAKDAVDTWVGICNKKKGLDDRVYNIASDIIKSCYVNRKTVLDISLSKIMSTREYTDQRENNLSKPLPLLPTMIDSLDWIEQLNIEGHNIGSVQFQNMSSLHTLRARNSGIIEFTLKNMPLLTILDISDNNNLDTVNIRKALVPNLKHLFIDADKVHLLEKCNLPDDCTVYVKNIRGCLKNSCHAVCTQLLSLNSQPQQRLILCIQQI